MRVGCTFIRCAIKKKEIEFCWDCEESGICDKWRKHREAGKQGDSFVSYQKLEDNIDFIQTKNLEDFQKEQRTRERLLKEMLHEFNEGRSKTLFCIAATILTVKELEHALHEATQESETVNIKKKAKILRQILETIADEKSYYLKLRKWKTQGAPSSM
jgi:hypothetical protein